MMTQQANAVAETPVASTHAVELAIDLRYVLDQTGIEYSDANIRAVLEALTALNPRSVMRP